VPETILCQRVERDICQTAVCLIPAAKKIHGLHLVGPLPVDHSGWGDPIPGAVAPVSIALRVTETHKLLSHDKAAVHEE